MPAARRKIFPPGSGLALRRSWRHLLDPPPHTLRIADGLRALSFLWVFLFHVGFFTSLHLAPTAFGKLLEQPALRLMWCGDLGVDVFFTISGFLIASLLQEELRVTGTVAVGRFYLRRALRLWPAYLTVLALCCKLGFPHCESAWANVLYVNNFLPQSRQCMAWSWSLAVEEQFYLGCPLLLLFLHTLRPRLRLPLLLALVTAATFVSFWSVLASGITLPLPIAESLDPTRAPHYFDVLYDKTQVRCGALLIGVLAALLRQRVVPSLARTPRLSTAGLIAVVTLLATVCLYPARVPTLTGVPRWLQVGYLGGFRYAVSASMAYVLLLGLGKHWAGKRVAAFLSHRFFYPLAQLSYSAYLIHPIVILAIYKLVPPAESLSLWALLSYAGAALFFTLGGAAGLYLFLERPFINLRDAWWPGSHRAPVKTSGLTGVTVEE